MTLILQIISQITGEELGSQEIRVAKNKEAIRDMRVRVLSGLQLTMNADQAGGPDKRRWVAQTVFSNVLTSKYQVKFLYTLTTTSLPNNHIYTYNFGQKINFYTYVLGGTFGYRSSHVRQHNN